MLSDDILAFNDAEAERVEVPEWGKHGQHVYVRLMSGRERDRWESSIMAMDGDATKFYDGVRARLCQMTACDESGTLIFTPAQIDALSQKSSTALQRIYDVAMRINKLRKSDLDELEKNSQSATSASSGLDSRRISESQSASASVQSVPANSANGLLTTA